MVGSREKLRIDERRKPRRAFGLTKATQLVFLFLLAMFFCASCLYSRTTAATYAVRKSITVDHGHAILDIYGRINENLYGSSPFGTAARPTNYYDNPAINEGTITKNELKNLSAGEEYSFSVLPTEVVTVNIRSLDEDDVEISVFENGRQRKYTIKGTDRLGLFLSFQNR